MKVVEYKRIEKYGTTSLCTMKFSKDSVVLDFGKKNGGKLKLPLDFLADSVEHYLTYIIETALKEIPCPSKRVPRK